VRQQAAANTTTTTTNLGFRERGADLFATGVDEVLLQRPRVEPAQDEDIEARSQHQAQDQVQGINVADLRAAGERDLLSEAQVLLFDNLQEHGVSTSVSIEVEHDADGNVVVPIIIDDDEKTAADEAAPPPPRSRRVHIHIPSKIATNCIFY
jgi:hypothetical protein